MKIKILYAASGAAYLCGAVTDAPTAIAKGLIERGDAEPAPKGAEVTYEWPKPEPVATPTEVTPAVTLDTPGVREVVAAEVAKVEADNKVAFDAAIQAVTDEFTGTLATAKEAADKALADAIAALEKEIADLKATAEADQAKAVEDAIAAVRAELAQPPAEQSEDKASA